MVALVVVWVAGLTVILGLIQVAIRWVAAGDRPGTPTLLALGAQPTVPAETLEAASSVD